MAHDDALNVVEPFHLHRRGAVGGRPIPELARGGVSLPAFMADAGLALNPAALFFAGAGQPLAVPFDGSGTLPDSTLPGFVLQLPGAGRGDISAAGRWSAGVWTVEFRRRLVTSDDEDAQFPMQE